MKSAKGPQQFWIILEDQIILEISIEQVMLKGSGRN